MKNRYKLALGSIVLALLAGACADMEMEDGQDEGDFEDAEETSTVEQGSWSPWYNLSGPNGSGYVRACKTSQRINWEFGYNSYAQAMTSGIGMSTIISNIAGQSWGQKYRTRGGATTFNIALGTNGNWKAIGWQVSQIPNC